MKILNRALYTVQHSDINYIQIETPQTKNDSNDGFFSFFSYVVVYNNNDYKQQAAKHVKSQAEQASPAYVHTHAQTAHQLTETI